MMSYLDQIWAWANQDRPPTQSQGRPSTATTHKTRAQSAYTRPATALRPVSGHTNMRPPSANTNIRPMSAYLSKESAVKEEVEITDKSNIKVDYTRLKHGEKEFYGGARTLHS